MRSGVIDLPVLVEFVRPTSLLREQHRRSALPILGNGPPGTFVSFPNGLRVSLPTDQILEADDTGGGVRVTFGGMRFVAEDSGQLIFDRVREMHPESELSPARSHRMILDAAWVASISANGRTLWTATNN
jgi:hypothetical protein